MHDLPVIASESLSSKAPKLLSDPFLQLPTLNSINVVWFTEFAGESHVVKYGEQLELVAIAKSTKLSRTREDSDSQIAKPTAKSSRIIWRHEAVIKIPPNQRLPYLVESMHQGQVIRSERFSLAAQPTPGSNLKILLTSDHQLMPMTTANLEQVAQTVGQVDAVFFPGDLVNVPDRASEWFDDQRGGAFFPSLQGKGSYQLEQNGRITTYRGAPIIQHAPLFPAIGNHEVMGIVAPNLSLKEEFNQPHPRAVARKLYLNHNQQLAAKNSSNWLKNHSFNTDTYEEIFSLPQESGNPGYYATTFGDIRLIALYVTNIWRSPSLEASDSGRYKESNQQLNNPEAWGYGQHIFEPIAKGSPQYQWLEQELGSVAYRQAKYKIVMFHHPPHTLGGNIVPPYTDPQPKIYYDDQGAVRSRYYDYPIENDYIVRDLLPLLESAGVQLVYYGHSHLWNRFQSESGMHFLESSNVGNSYGAHWGDNQREIPTYSPQNFAPLGNPNALEPIVPNIAPLLNSAGDPLPFVASNEITVFSILETVSGTVSSYRYDTREPGSEAILFDRFQLKQN